MGLGRGWGWHVGEWMFIKQICKESCFETWLDGSLDNEWLAGSLDNECVNLVFILYKYK